ncbi:DUF397 domain-containing protein [Streptomyces sp. NPDC057702]|uniref:DUF397 domain-containing protein n=1 Tax=unclassified Streptomyces TaxID=2593676 RepID=UPI0036AFAE2F
MSSIRDASTLIGWVKSSFSGGSDNGCVAWVPTYARDHGTVPVRDSKDPSGPALTFEPAAWNAFITSVKAGEFRG